MTTINCMNLRRATEEISLFARGYAPVANLSVNTVCNQRCLICQRWKMHWQKESDKLSLPEIKDMVYQLVKDLHVKRFRITSTEPLLRPDLPEIIAYIRQFTGCSLITNGMAMTGEMARRLIDADVSKVRFSVDSPNQVNDVLRGVKGAWERSRRGIEIMKEVRDKKGKPYPEIDIYTVLTKLNIGYIPDMYRFVAEMGLDGLAFGVVWENTPEGVDGTVWKGRKIARNHMIPVEESLKPTPGQIKELREELVQMGLITRGTERTKKAIERILRLMGGRRRIFRCPYHYFINVDPVGNFIPCTAMG
ncbi:radical SAM protein, partial [candidate division WOR-3 bacterium]|nr:radical SAM protein [candidate division WOR-3 bacterium]MBD3365567.1 radical SAM protein [candidate division WOR-3 bacterium]